MNPQKKMYKVIHAMEKKGGGTYWMRVGSAFTNRDDSINIYLDAVPAPNGKSARYEFQIRELNDEDLRRREAFASGNSGRANGGGNGGHGSNDSNDSNDDNGGGGGSYVAGGGSFGTGGGGYRDLGGIGGGPSTRAVTSSASSDEIPF